MAESHPPAIDLSRRCRFETDFTNGGTLSRFAGWAEIGNLCVVGKHRRRSIASLLVANAADWLRIARVERLLAYASPEAGDELAFSRRVGFRELVRTKRGWVRQS
jgi:GNAT superfamily N-acetyltransferase